MSILVSACLSYQLTASLVLAQNSTSSDTEYQKAIITIGVLAGAFIIAIIIAKIVDYCYDHHIAINDNDSDISEHTRNLIRARLVVNKLGQLRKPKTKDKDDAEDGAKKEVNTRKILRLWSARAKESRRIAEQRRAEADLARQKKDMVIKVEEAVGGARLEPSPTGKAATLLVVNDSTPTTSPRQQKVPPRPASPAEKPAPFKRTLTGLNGSLRTTDSTGFARVAGAGNAAFFPKQAFVEPLALDGSPTDDIPVLSLDSGDGEDTGGSPQTEDTQTAAATPCSQLTSQLTTGSDSRGLEDSQLDTGKSRDTGTSTGRGKDTERESDVASKNVSSEPTEPVSTNSPPPGRSQSQPPKASKSSKDSGNQASQAPNRPVSGELPVAGSEAPSDKQKTDSGHTENRQNSEAQAAEDMPAIPEIPSKSDDVIKDPETAGAARPVSGVSRKLFTVVLPNQFQSTNRTSSPGSRSPTRAQTPAAGSPSKGSQPRSKSITPGGDRSPAKVVRTGSVQQTSGLAVHKNTTSAKKVATSRGNNGSAPQPQKGSRVKSAVL